MGSRISFKLILAVAAVLVATIGGFSYLLTRSQQRALVAQVERNAHQVSETIKSSTLNEMLLNRPENLHRMIDTIGAQDGIDQIRIFNKEGTITYASDATLVGSLVDKRAEACFACHAADQPLEQLSIDERTRQFTAPEGIRKLGIINPIYNAPACSSAPCHAHPPEQRVLGVLDITMSLAEADRQLWASKAQAAGLAITAVAAIALIIWLVFEKLVGQPVRQLVRATRHVAEGEFGARVDVRRADELGLLASSFNDMTERLSEAQAQLYQSDKLASLGRLAAGVAHEINNPLTGVLTYGSFLLKRATDPQQREDLETIVRETKRCRRIVKGLLDFSRQAKPQKSLVDLRTIVEQALRIVHNRLSFDDIEVRTEVPDNLPRLTADPDQLVQVFINLLVNAADAIGKHGGAIEILARDARADGRDELEIEIRDTGCGIPPEDVSKVFEPFYTTKDQEGTGLGLAVVWGIVDKHGGRIDIASDLDRGTTITVHLPCGTPAVVPAEEVRV